MVLFKRVAKAQDHALNGKAINPDVQARQQPVQRHVVVRFSHDRIGQWKPMLKKANAQHGFYREGRASALRVPVRGMQGVIATRSFQGTIASISLRNTCLLVPHLFDSKLSAAARLVCFIQ